MAKTTDLSKDMIALPKFMEMSQATQIIEMVLLGEKITFGLEYQ
jgi:hypothetical protein